MTDFDGWSSDAVVLVTRAMAVHGGLERWRATTSISLPFRRGSGPLLRIKGFGDTFPAPRTYQVHPHRGVTIFHGYPDEQHRGTFERGQVTIAHVDGTQQDSSPDHRRTFAGLAKYRRWSTLDALYFFGYALVHYHSVPFTLPQARLERVLRRGGVPVGVDVLLPRDVHTHSARQRFIFGDDGRIVRHDYVADVIGWWARGAHYWEDYTRCRGLLIACRRRVVARIAHMPTPATVLCIQLGEPTIEEGILSA